MYRIIGVVTPPDTRRNRSMDAEVEEPLGRLRKEAAVVFCELKRQN
jgi:hypothetical protein